MKRVAIRCLFALGVMAGLSGQVPLEEHRERRAALRQALPGALIVVAGASEKDSGDIRGGFFQEPNFYYLTGWREPGALAVITPDSDILFLPERSERRERYTGRKLAASDPQAAETTGFAQVASLNTLENRLRELAAKHPDLYWTGAPDAQDHARRANPDRNPASAYNAVARLRATKSPREIELIQRSVDVTVAAHKNAWVRAAGGLFEYQVGATMTNTYYEAGCERNAYAPIIGSGPNGVILHYSANKRRMDAGELLLMDVGAECAAYAADITRTIPISGKFTARQREVYEVVLGAQNAAIAAAKPGVRFSGDHPESLNSIAKRYIDTHGKTASGDSLGKYFTHGLGHHVGLEVHDAYDFTKDPDFLLAPGMVITIEPGVYLPDEGIGVRIEDVILITPDGARILSSALPREPAEIERFLQKARKRRR